MKTIYPRTTVLKKDEAGNYLLEVASDAGDSVRIVIINRVAVSIAECINNHDEELAIGKTVLQ